MFIKNGIINTMNIKTFHREVELKAGSTFGELALINHQLRAARIVALEITQLAYLDKYEFQRIRENSIRQDVADKVIFLKEIPLFYELNHGAAERIALTLGKSKTIKRGMSLFN